jgi:hypothetical protein
MAAAAAVFKREAKMGVGVRKVELQLRRLGEAAVAEAAGKGRELVVQNLINCHNNSQREAAKLSQQITEGSSEAYVLKHADDQQVLHAVLQMGRRCRSGGGGGAVASAGH